METNDQMKYDVVDFGSNLDGGMRRVFMLMGLDIGNQL